MRKGFIEVNITNDDLNSTGSKKIESKKSIIENETEQFGILEINNKSSKLKMRNKKELGYEKNIIGSQKKTIKNNLNKIDDYFDFDFRKNRQEKPNNIQENNEKEKLNIEQNSKSCLSLQSKVQKVAKNEQISKENLEKVLKNNLNQSIMQEQSKKEREICIMGEMVEKTIDEEAAKIITVARMGALFDCEKCMIN